MRRGRGWAAGEAVKARRGACMARGTKAAALEAIDRIIAPTMVDQLSVSLWNRRWMGLYVVEAPNVRYCTSTPMPTRSNAGKERG